jgi:hypothetical protein
VRAGSPVESPGRCARTMTRRRGSRLLIERVALPPPLLRARWRHHCIGAQHLAVNRARAWEWDSDVAGDIPSYRRGRPSIWSLSYRTPAGAMPALCLTAATVSDSTLRTRSIQSNCRDRRSIGHCFLSLRRMCTTANSGRAGFFARNASPFSPAEMRGRPFFSSDLMMRAHLELVLSSPVVN